ncbi:hypothetical protein [Kitasatospora sp. LaBMicrA B282]|uniref:hypothetical protein n=1 Tax=Kitasatospora sp. LaBMicrA B282 TaxID=3420949 RepID=UPI003D0A22B0
MSETTTAMAAATDPRTLISPEVRELILTTYRVQHPEVPASRTELGVGQMAAFLTACAVGDRPLSPSPEVDDYWHAFVLNTKAYMTWCTASFGKMVHQIARENAQPWSAPSAPAAPGPGRRPRAAPCQPPLVPADVGQPRAWGLAPHATSGVMVDA